MHTREKARKGAEKGFHGLLSFHGKKNTDQSWALKKMNLTLTPYQITSKQVWKMQENNIFRYVSINFSQKSIFCLFLT